MDAQIRALKIIVFDDIKHGVNGYLVPCYDTSIFAKHLYDVLYDENKRKKMDLSLSNYNPMRVEDEATSIVNYSSKFV